VGGGRAEREVRREAVLLQRRLADLSDKTGERERERERAHEALL